MEVAIVVLFLGVLIFLGNVFNRVFALTKIPDLLGTSSNGLHRVFGLLQGYPILQQPPVIVPVLHRQGGYRGAALMATSDLYISTCR